MNKKLSIWPNTHKITKENTLQVAHIITDNYVHLLFVFDLLCWECLQCTSGQTDDVFFTY